MVGPVQRVRVMATLPFQYTSFVGVRPLDLRVSEKWVESRMPIIEIHDSGT
jgi:hypothetical protein